MTELSKFLNAVDMDNYRTIRDGSLGDDLAYSDILQICMINMKENLTIGELGQLMNLSKPAITQKVNDLVSRGIVEKISSPTDKRYTYLVLSKEFQQSCEHSKVLNLNIEIESNFSLEEQEIFNKVLGHLSDYLLNE